MFFLAIPPLTVLVEVVVTTAVGTLVTLATKDAYDKLTQPVDDQE